MSAPRRPLTSIGSLGGPPVVIAFVIVPAYSKRRRSSTFAYGGFDNIATMADTRNALRFLLHRVCGRDPGRRRLLRLHESGAGGLRRIHSRANLILESIIGSAAVARSWTSYLTSLLNQPRTP
ncbi:hypothetical protein C4D60_Mb07t15800 [Musa balbisiana]|uniref:Uncharacterized protein n=1 Tax=Musa balbisiana TaxID=52838 RepID=A0A4S8JFL0_MUSBA|nr:hypothetical protein C4D60_Mb07t15800 [Musa balbisiana]